ncbi:D-2-hydroxyacid dehydrogenase [Anaerosinus sp.]|uniref:D-2-hydroxyacid dehydrogenase n=1 Tax=Selenobaculum sp. TaxID=3074374 RepID=UPI003AB6D362
MIPSLNILVLNRLSEKELTSIQDTVPNANITLCKPENAPDYIENTDILVTWGHLSILNLLPKAPRLKWIHALSAGVDELLIPDLIESDIILTNSRGIHGIPMAEHVMAMILTLSRQIPESLKNQQNKLWQRTRPDEIYDKTIGIIGLGSIGREIAKRSKAMGMKVIATKRTQTTEIFVNKLYSPEQLDIVLSASDFVVVTLPLTDKTRNLFVLDKFKSMKKTAYFINVARGSIVHQPDLVTALKEGYIKGAALDVVDIEPLSSDSPLWEMENVLITPHVAAMSPYYLERAIKLFIENLTKYMHSTDMLNVIDKAKGY